MNVEAWLKKAKEQVDNLDAELIAVKAFAPLRTDRSWLVAHGDQKLTKIQLKHAEKFLQKRRQGVPLAYVLGEKEFYGRTFYVTPDVLIPRPETEGLIDLIKELDLPKKPRFLEVGTGSGCIAITLALEYPQSYVLATDVSLRALDVARDNDFIFEGRVEYRQSNMLRDLDFWCEDGEDLTPDLGADLPELGLLDELLDDQLDNSPGENDDSATMRSFDVVVANLPYVNKDWSWVDEQALKYEPKNALYAKANNGLSLYKRLFKELCALDARYVVVEADPCQHEDLVKLAQWRGWVHVKTEGYGLVFETRFMYWWDYREQKLIHKTKEEEKDFGLCRSFEGFTDQELRARSEPRIKTEKWFR